MGLTVPNAFEVALISKVRHYHNAIKIQTNGGPSCRDDRTQSKMKARSILFEHDAPTQSCLALKWLYKNTSKTHIEGMVAERITVQFVASKGEMDNLIKTTLGSTLVSARAYVVYQWLQVLQAVNPLYNTDPPLPPFPDVASRIQQSNDVVFEQATRITDKDTLRFEAALGDDVAGVRTTSNALEHNEDYATSDPTKALHEEQETPTSYSVVCDRVPCSNRDRGVSDNALQTVQVLEDAAAALDIDVEPNVKKWFDLDLMIMRCKRRRHTAG